MKIFLCRCGRSPSSFRKDGLDTWLCDCGRGYVNDTDNDIEQTVQQYNDIKSLLISWAKIPVDTCARTIEIGLLSADDVQFPEKVWSAMATLLEEYNFPLVILKKLNNEIYNERDLLVEP